MSFCLKAQATGSTVNTGGVWKSACGWRLEPEDEIGEENDREEDPCFAFRRKIGRPGE
jgi:hypothetical protein